MQVHVPPSDSPEKRGGKLPLKQVSRTREFFVRSSDLCCPLNLLIARFIISFPDSSPLFPLVFPRKYSANKRVLVLLYGQWFCDHSVMGKKPPPPKNFSLPPAPHEGKKGAITYFIRGRFSVEKSPKPEAFLHTPLPRKTRQMRKRIFPEGNAQKMRVFLK